MLKRLLLCLVTSIICYSYFDTSNAMESNLESNQDKINSECILCRADPDELFSLGNYNKEQKYDNSICYKETFDNTNDFADCFSRFPISYNNMWERVLDELQSTENITCNKNHYKIGNYDFKCLFKVIQSWNNWIDKLYCFDQLNNWRCKYDFHKFYLKDHEPSYKLTKELLEDFLCKYFSYNCDEKDYLLESDPFHKVIINEFCNAKLLDKKHIKYFFGSKNLYEALIVSLIRFKLSKFSIEELLFNMGECNIACFDFKNDEINSFLKEKDISYSLILEYFKGNKELKQSSNIPLIISKLNDVSYYEKNGIFGTGFDFEKLDNSNLTSNLEKVLNAFEFCKLKFDFELNDKELKIINLQKDNISEFISFIFTVNNTDYDKYDDVLDTGVLDEWCTEIVEKLCNSADNLKSYKLFDYIDEAIKSKKDFLKYLLAKVVDECNEDDINKLRNALLNYYKDKLSKDKYMIIEQFNI